MAKLKYLVLHCTATPEGREVTADDIRRWHTAPVAAGGRGWRRVGYTDRCRRLRQQLKNIHDATVLVY